VVKIPMVATMTAMLVRAPAEDAASPRLAMMGAAAREHAQLKRLSFCDARHA
jgi:hypothetical protein